MHLAALAEQIFIYLSWILALAWLWQGITARHGMRGLPVLTPKYAAELPPLPEWDGPHLTVVVPACNEEAAIESTLRSLLDSSGLRLQIIAVDDRSADRTGELMDKVAVDASTRHSPHSLQIVHVRELPPGWLGKPHAMATGAQRTLAPWILFTDGDVSFDPDALVLALRQAIAGRADHLVLVPSLILKTTGERAMLSAMQALAQWTIRLWKVPDPRARDFIGVGGFNLVRREIYERLGGFESLRMEVLDDLRLGWKIKRAGFAQHIVLGPGLVRIRWINGSLAVIHLVEKNGFAVYRFRVWLHLLACLGLALQAVLPVAAILAGGWAFPAGVLAYVGIAMVYSANGRITQIRARTAVFFAPAAAVVTYGFLRSMVLALARRGVDWRGTRYPLRELRRNAGPFWWSRRA